MNPLTPSDFTALLTNLPPRVAVAVSGGPDSMALVWGAKAAGYDVLALIVEHGLRAESAQEACTVCDRLAAMGIEAIILPWQHEAIKSRVHVRARAARYALLIEACKARGHDTLLLAHHRDDQAETVLMRFAKGSGLAGLAGMAVRTKWDGITLVRPLLDVAKAQLLATCQAQGIPYVTDPSNESDHYARGRLRRAGAVLAQEGFTSERLLDFAARAGEAAEAIDFYAKDYLRAHAHMTEGGAVRLDPSGLEVLPRAVALQALTLILTSLHRDAYPPQRAGLLPALDYILGQGDGAAHSFYGCLIQKGARQILVLREPSAVRDVQEAQDCSLWDSRWVVSGAGEGQIRPLGVQGHEILDLLAPQLRKRVPEGRVRATLPALWRGVQLVAIPALFSDEKESFFVTFLPPHWL